MTLQNPNKLFPLFVTSNLAETKRFYTQVVGFTPSVDTPEYLQLSSADKDGPELCFMTPEAFGNGTVLPPFGGVGVIVSIPTPDADKKHASVLEAGAQPDTTPANKPWGWRSFLVRDPNGLVLDFFHVVEQKSM
jgi:predicted enzyme related to lactoylglutathione lyase